MQIGLFQRGCRAIGAVEDAHHLFVWRVGGLEERARRLIMRQWCRAFDAAVATALAVTTAPRVRRQ
jgi:hypothetical protein